MGGVGAVGGMGIRGGMPTLPPRKDDLDLRPCSCRRPSPSPTQPKPTLLLTISDLQNAGPRSPKRHGAGGGPDPKFQNKRHQHNEGV